MLEATLAGVCARGFESCKPRARSHWAALTPIWAALTRTTGVTFWREGIAYLGCQVQRGRVDARSIQSSRMCSLQPFGASAHAIAMLPKPRAAHRCRSASAPPVAPASRAKLSFAASAALRASSSPARACSTSRCRAATCVRVRGNAVHRSPAVCRWNVLLPCKHHFWREGSQ
jgi:hypothetical protein